MFKDYLNYNAFGVIKVANMGIEKPRKIDASKNARFCEEYKI